MALKIDIDNHRLVVPQRGGCFFILGAVFVSFAAVLANALKIGFDTTFGGRLQEPIVLGWPLVAITLVALLSFYRHEREVDFSTQIVTRKVGILFTLWKSSTPLGQPQHVSVAREVVSNGKQSQVKYPLLLVGQDLTLCLSNRGPAAWARREAERVAKLAGVPLHDSTAGDLHIREADALDQSILDAERHQLQAPRRPAQSKIEVTQRGMTTVVRLPLARVPLLLFVAMGLPMTVFSLLFWRFAWWGAMHSGNRVPSASDEVFSYAVLIFIIASAGAGLFRASRRGLFGSRLKVDAQGLTVNGRTFSNSELEELRVISILWGNILFARSDAKDATFGRGLELEDLDYLRALILWALAGRVV